MYTMGMKPLIGVSPDFNSGDRQDMGGREPTYFLRARYVEAIQDLGGTPVILPLVSDPAVCRQLLKGLDGLVLTGSGSDLEPKLYGEQKHYPFKVMSRKRAAFEIEMARVASQTTIPILGICGGMQSLNVALGGNLYQDILSQIPRSRQHLQTTKATRMAHSIAITPRSLLRNILRQAKVRVNSSHHQSVKDVAPSLTISATAPDGIIEAIESPRHPFLLGVQWHPEFLYKQDPMARRLFKAFLRASVTPKR